MSWGQIAGASQGPRALGVAGAVLGLGAGALGLLVGVSRANRPRANAAAALVVVAAGGADLVVGAMLSNALLLVIGGVAALSGLALGRAVIATTGRSLFAVLAGADISGPHGYENVRQCAADEAAMVLEGTDNVVVVPGYGLARAQAQHGVKELSELLQKRGARVRVVVHPAAGIVPGHMNVLLDEAGIAHETIIDATHAAAAVAGADVVVVGANDVINSGGARSTGPLEGLDALDLSTARSVWVIKRSLGPGQTNVKNQLFEQPNVTMVLGDAKKVLQSLVAHLKGGAH